MTEPAPIPWLAAALQNNDATAQAWANRELAPVRLCVRYKMSAADYRRITLAQLLRVGHIFGIVVLVMFGLFVMFICGLTLYIQQTTGRTMPSPLPFIGTSLLKLNIYPLILGMAAVAAIPLLCAPFVERFDKPGFVELTIRGVIATGSYSTFRKVLPWTLFSAVERLRSGDIDFVLRFGMGMGIAVPRSAFADTDSANRFHGAALALWKANGAPVGVAEAIRAEFAPPEAATKP